MRSAVRACSMLLMTCALLADSASARDYLNCLTNKVVIVDAASGSTSSKTEENLGFWIDETAKNVTLADGTPLIIPRDGVTTTRIGPMQACDVQGGRKAPLGPAP